MVCLFSIYFMCPLKMIDNRAALNYKCIPRSALTLSVYIGLQNS